MTGLGYTLGVIIVVGKVLIEIRLGNRPVLLWNPRKHGVSKNLHPSISTPALAVLIIRQETGRNVRVLRLIPSWVRQFCLLIRLE